jgi:hypothetical protein
MPDPHYLPIPAALCTLACETVSRRVGRLPFVRKGVTVTCNLIAAGMESLNAQATRTLLLKHRTGTGSRIQIDGLDRLLQERGFAEPDTAPILSGVLKRAGIAEQASVTDRQSRLFMRGIRLLSAWAWHIASGTQKPFPLPGTTASVPAEPRSWKNLCPVCRTGMLNPVTGQRLFGIPATDFLACTHCGAKFVPDNKNFRLVSIAVKKDPLWGRYLNATMSPDAWEAIALDSGSPEKKQRVHTRGDHRQKTTSSTKEKNIPGAGGRLAVPVGTRTLYFTPLSLHYQRRGIHDLFSRNTTTLKEMIGLPGYRHLAGVVLGHYVHYIHIPVGLFLLELKTRRDGFYWEFLNNHGDETYCAFRTDSGALTAQRGVFVVAVNGEIRATGPCFDSFCQTVNDKLGWLLPEACYLTGDPDHCRINALMCSHRKDGGIFVHMVDDDAEIDRIVMELNAEYRMSKD